MVISHALRIFNDIQRSVGAIWIQNLRTQKWASTSGWSFEATWKLPQSVRTQPSFPCGKFHPAGGIYTVSDGDDGDENTTAILQFYRHLMILMFRKIWSWHELTVPWALSRGCPQASPPTTLQPPPPRRLVLGAARSNSCRALRSGPCSSRRWRWARPWTRVAWRNSWVILWFMCIYVYWCVLMCIDVSWCVFMCVDVYWCVLMCIYVYWCVLMCIYVYWCVLMCIDVYLCVFMCIDVYWCVLMCIYVYWCVFMCIYVYWCVLMCIDVYLCVFMCIYVYLCVLMCIDVYWCVFMCIYVYLCVFMCIYVYWCVLMCIYVYLCVFMCAMMCLIIWRCSFNSYDNLQQTFTILQYSFIAIWCHM